MSAGRAFLLSILAVSLGACGGGGGTNPPPVATPPPSPPPPPEPPPIDPTAPLVMSADNLDDVLVLGGRIPEYAYAIVAYALNHLSTLAGPTGGFGSLECRNLGISASAVNLDEDNSGTLSAGDTVTVSIPDGCNVALFSSAIQGGFAIELERVFVGRAGDTLFNGTVNLSSDPNSEDDDSNDDPPTIGFGGRLSFSAALRGESSHGLRVWLEPGEELLLVFDANQSAPLLDRVGELDLLHRMYPQFLAGDRYEVSFQFSYESSVLGGQMVCASNGEISGQNRSFPTTGGYTCRGANGAAIALRSDRPDDSDALVVELDAEGDGTFEVQATNDLDWDDFIGGPLFEEGIEGAQTAFFRSAVNAQSVSAAVNDLVYDPLNNRLYVSNPVGISEIDPETLAVLRTTSLSDEPGPIALSDDGSTLWVGFEQIAEAVSVNVLTLEPGPRIQLGQSSVSGEERLAADIVVVPGTIDEVVIATKSGDDVVAYNGGVALANELTRTASDLVFSDANTLVGVDNTNSGFEVSRIGYNSQSGLVVEGSFRDLSPGFGARLMLGSSAIWNSRGFSFTVSNGVRLGSLAGLLGDTSGRYDLVAVDSREGLVFAFRDSGRVIDVFDETTRARLGRYGLAGTTAIRGSSVAVASRDALIIAGESELLRIPKADLTPNIDAESCDVLSLEGLLSDRQYDVSTCQLLDIDYDAGRNLIYGAVPAANGPFGNSIAVINADTFEYLERIPLTAQPTRVDISDDGSVLTVALDGAAQVAEIDLDTRSIKRITDLGYAVVNGQLRGDPLVAVATRARPGFPDEIAVATEGSEVLLYAEGVQQTEFLDFVEDYEELYFDTDDSTKFIARGDQGVRVFRINGSGIVELGDRLAVLQAGGVSRQSNRLLDGLGRDLNIGTLFGAQACSFDPSNFAIRVASFGTDGVSAYFGESEPRQALYRCNLSTGEVTAPIRVPRFSQDERLEARRLFQIADGHLVYLDRAALIKLDAPY